MENGKIRPAIFGFHSDGCLYLRLCFVAILNCGSISVLLWDYLLCFSSEPTLKITIAELPLGLIV